MDVDTLVTSKMCKDGFTWYCNECNYNSMKKSHLFEHIESKHVSHSGYSCSYCGKVLKTKAAFGRHRKQCS